MSITLIGIKDLVEKSGYAVQGSIFLPVKMDGQMGRGMDRWPAGWKYSAQMNI